MKIVVIGVAGFVGSTVASALVEQGMEVIGIDDISFGRLERLTELRERIEYWEMKFEDFSGKRITNIDAVINCAAVAPLPDNQEDHYRCLRLNVSLKKQN